MKYIIFIKPECPYCIKTIDLLKSKKKKYKAIKFKAGQEETLREVKEAYGWQTVPIVFLWRKDSLILIGGYTELSEHINK